MSPETFKISPQHAYPRNFGLLFWQHFAIIIGPILENAQFPEELSQYIYAIIHAKKHPSDHINDLKLFWNHHFEGTEPRRMHSALLRSLDDTLEEIITITETVGFFTGLATILFLAKHPMSNQFLPLLSGEEFRLQRALLRFQLYRQLFHSPQDYKKCHKFWD